MCVTLCCSLGRTSPDALTVTALQVYTVDATDPSSVRKAVMNVLSKGDLQPLVPYELTAEVLCIHTLHGHDVCVCAHARARVCVCQCVYMSEVECTALWSSADYRASWNALVPLSFTKTSVMART